MNKTTILEAKKLAYEFIELSIGNISRGPSALADGGMLPLCRRLRASLSETPCVPPFLFDVCQRGEPIGSPLLALHLQGDSSRASSARFDESALYGEGALPREDRPLHGELAPVQGLVSPGVEQMVNQLVQKDGCLLLRGEPVADESHAKEAALAQGQFGSVETADPAPQARFAGHGPVALAQVDYVAQRSAPRPDPQIMGNLCGDELRRARGVCPVPRNPAARVGVSHMDTSMVSGRRG